MSDIRFYIPKGVTIPTDLCLYVDDTYVIYKRIDNGFRFYISLDDEAEAMNVVTKIVQQMISDHDESRHGVSWRTISLHIVPQEERYRLGIIIDWKYRVRDSY